MKKAIAIGILVMVLIAPFADAAVKVTKIVEDGTVCTAILVDADCKRANGYEGLSVYKDNVLLREVGARNNVWQMPVEISLNPNCDVYALYPEYDNRFQNLFKNGRWIKDLPLIR